MVKMWRFSRDFGLYQWRFWRFSKCKLAISEHLDLATLKVNHADIQQRRSLKMFANEILINYDPTN